jgi:multidrug transporter EmrE-like cation transporter
VKTFINLPAGIFIASFVFLSATGSLCLRVASQRSGPEALGFFAAGNVVGFFGTIFLTLALRTQHPNITYALCQGGAFCVLQLAALLFFRVPLTPPQWLGIVLIACGVVCVQLRP